MIVKELISENEERVYSDLHLKILEVETQVICDEVTHTLPCDFTYTETDIPIPEEEEKQ